MDTFKIRAFLTAVKYKNFSKAAEEYSYTPSAFSHMAHSLGEELGVALFKRTPSGIELTKEGTALYEKFEAILKAEDDLFLYAKELSKKKTNEIRIGAYSSISKYLLPEIIKDFKKDHPNVKISLTVSLNLRGWIATDKADIVFADSNALKNDEWFPIMEDPFVAVIPPTLFQNQTSITLEELYAHPYINTKETVYRDRVDLSRFKETISLRAEDDVSVISMVSEGLGVAILPRLSCIKHQDKVRILKIEPSISRTLCIAHKAEPTGNEKLFLNFAKKYTLK